MKKLLPLLAYLFFFATQGFSQGLPNSFLGRAETFTVLAATAVNNVDETISYADLGVSPGTTVVGFPPGQVRGSTYVNNPDAVQAQADSRIAYNALASTPATRTVSGPIGSNSALVPYVLTPGVYRLDANALVTGVLTLDGGDDVNSVFIFQVANTLTTAQNSGILLIRGAQPKNVFWQVGGATPAPGLGDVFLGSGSVFKGTILASNRADLDRGASVEGRVIALSDRIDLDFNNIFLPNIIETNLSVTKTVGPGPYEIGRDVTFTITVRNLGPDNATGVKVNEVLPPSLQFKTFSGPGGITYDPTTGIISVGNLPFGESVVLTLVATIRSSGPINNTVTVVGNEPEIAPGNNESGVTIVVPVASTDLAVTKTISPVRVTYNVGETITYTVTGRNNGPDNATNVVINDLLPPGLTLVSFQVTQGTYNPATGIFNVNNLNNGLTAVLTIVARINQSGPITNTAVISGGQTDQIPGNNTASVTINAVAVPVADLGINKTISAGPYSLNGEVTYSITATNNGPDNATGVIVNEVLPSSLTFISFVASQGTTFNPATGVFNIGNLANGQSVTLTIVARINRTGSITNNVVITGNQIDPNPGGGDDDFDNDGIDNDEDTDDDNDGIPDNTDPDDDNDGIPDNNDNDDDNDGIIDNNDDDDDVNSGPGDDDLDNDGIDNDEDTDDDNDGITDGTDPDDDNDGIPDDTDPDDDNDGIPDTDDKDDSDQNGGDNGGGNGGGDNEDEVTICVLPPAPLAVTGPANVCAGTTVAYSVPAISGATSYTFTLPEGWNSPTGRIIVVPAGAGTPTISVTAGTTSGPISVFATNSCGNGPATSLTISSSAAPVTGAVTISAGTVNSCSGSQVTFTTPTVAGATAYRWTVPAGSTIVSGQSTNTINVLLGTTAGNVTVMAENACGLGNASTLAIAPATTPASPAAITDNSGPCGGLAFTIAAVPGAISYTWTVSPGFTIIEGAGTTSVKVRANTGNEANNGTISVVASNGTCASNASTIEFDATKARTQLTFPNAISPGTSIGKNDTWEVGNLLNFPENTVVIYNRWGNEVYRKQNYRNDWAAIGLEQGTYFYILQVNECGKTNNYKGSITVYR